MKNLLANETKMGANGGERDWCSALHPNKHVSLKMVDSSIPSWRSCRQPKHNLCVEKVEDAWIKIQLYIKGWAISRWVWNDLIRDWRTLTVFPRHQYNLYMRAYITWNRFAHEIAPRGLVVPTYRDETTIVDIFVTHKQWLSTFSSTML
jgi:hypothetical protein